MVSTFLIATAMLILIKPILSQTLSPISSYGTISYPLPGAFRETCDTWDATKWTYEYNKPQVVNGTWVFNFPAGWRGAINPRRIAYTGYGTYTVQLKTSGPLPSGVDYWIFLYVAPDGDYQPTHNELDLAEIWGGHTAGEYSISFWVNGEGGGAPGMGGIGYWYFNTLSRVGINWEDGNWHTFTYIYSADDLIVNLDGLKIFKWTEDCEDIGALGIPFPPMYFYIGGGGKGTQTSGFSLIVDEIEYRPLVG